MEFTGFPKIARLNREIVVTEKIDGTNAQIKIDAYTDAQWDARRASDDVDHLRNALAVHYRTTHLQYYVVRAGSRNRYLSVDADNFGFARWVNDNLSALIEVLGEGQHFGEWYGPGIQRGYNLQHKCFALFNTQRWGWLRSPDLPSERKAELPQGLTVVPELYKGKFDQNEINYALYDLKANGSRVSNGPFAAEGIVVYHTAANQLFKVTCHDDAGHKGVQA